MQHISATLYNIIILYNVELNNTKMNTIGDTLGIIPIFCEELFREVEAKRNESSETEYQVCV